MMFANFTETALHEHLGAYQRDGYCVFKQAVSPPSIKTIGKWLDSACERAADTPTFEAQFENQAQPRAAEVRKLRRLFWNDEAFWRQLLGAEGFFGLVKRIVSPDPALVFHAAFLKPASVGSKVAYHQDQALWKYNYPNAANLWLAVTPSKVRNGCIRVCPGSHKKGVIPHIAVPDYPHHDSIDLVANGLVSHPVEMDAGDVLLWDRFLVHGSEANTSPEARKGVVMVFVDGSVKDFKATDAFFVNEHSPVAS
jgi:ectoine hydroxylase-related dioxygenase (phytanoyl-CoA dioxygenase family)